MKVDVKKNIKILKKNPWIAPISLNQLTFNQPSLIDKCLELRARPQTILEMVLNLKAGLT